MSFRVQIGILLLRLSDALKAMIPLVLTPKALMETNRMASGSRLQVETWGKDKWIRKGLLDIEKNFLERYNITSGRILVLACGGGREAIALAKLGFDVVGIDFVDELLEIARLNAADEKVIVYFEKQDITNLSLDERSFDHAILSSFMYSFIPVDKKRIEMLKSIRSLLRPSGKFLLTLNLNLRKEYSKRMMKDRIKKVIAFLLLGNRHYRPGDVALDMGDSLGVIHNFCSRKEFLDEVKEADFEAKEINAEAGYAVLS